MHGDFECKSAEFYHKLKVCRLIKINIKLCVQECYINPENREEYSVSTMDYESVYCSHIDKKSIYISGYLLRSGSSS